MQSRRCDEIIHDGHEVDDMGEGVFDDDLVGFDEEVFEVDDLVEVGNLVCKYICISI